MTIDSDAERGAWRDSQTTLIDGQRHVEPPKTNLITKHPWLRKLYWPFVFYPFARVSSYIAVIIYTSSNGLALQDSMTGSFSYIVMAAFIYVCIGVYIAYYKSTIIEPNNNGGKALVLIPFVVLVIAGVAICAQMNNAEELPYYATFAALFKVIVGLYALDALVLGLAAYVYKPCS